MSLPNSYTLKTGAISDYFEAILNAEAPDRFSHKFLEGIGFASSNDRLLIGILKELGFLTTDGAPTDRYFAFLDRSNSARVLAEGIREAYSDLFAVNTTAYEMTSDQVFNKLRTLYKGDKKETVIKHISKTFISLCDYADFTQAPKPALKSELAEETAEVEPSLAKGAASTPEVKERIEREPAKIDLGSLQYHINIVLPDTRDQAVYDAIFKSMRDHLG